MDLFEIEVIDTNGMELHISEALLMNLLLEYFDKIMGERGFLRVRVGIRKGE